MKNELLRQRIHKIVERDGLIDERHPALQRRPWYIAILALLGLRR